MNIPNKPFLEQLSKSSSTKWNERENEQPKINWSTFEQNVSVQKKNNNWHDRVLNIRSTAATKNKWCSEKIIVREICKTNYEKFEIYWTVFFSFFFSVRSQSRATLKTKRAQMNNMVWLRITKYSVGLWILSKCTVCVCMCVSLVLFSACECVRNRIPPPVKQYTNTLGIYPLLCRTVWYSSNHTNTQSHSYIALSLCMLA